VTGILVLQYSVTRSVAVALYCFTAQRVAVLIILNTLQHTAAYCSTLQHRLVCCSTDQARGAIRRVVTDNTRNNTLQHTATHCNTLHHTASRIKLYAEMSHASITAPSATTCNTLRRTTSHCNTLQYDCDQTRNFHTPTSCSNFTTTSASHCNSLECTITQKLQHKSNHTHVCHKRTLPPRLHHIAAHCNS